MERHCVFIATFMLILHLVQAQDSTGFINVGCGLPPHESPYNALPTGLSYTSDIGLVNTGKTGRIAKEFEPNYTKPLTTLRYFPDGVRNCYTLNVTRDTKYLIMAKFVYGNYDGLKTDPNFDLYFGPNIWTTVSKNDTREEIIHVTKSNSLQVCLVKTGTSIPFINILELRPLRSTAYVTQSGSLKYLFRVYLSNSRLGIRYPDDIYDRAWFPYFDEKSWTQVTTNLTVNITNNYELPQGVAATGATPLNDAETLNITWDVEPPTAKFYTYMHFAELQTLRANDTREFNTTMNGKYSYGPYTPTPLKIETVLDVKPEECDEGACILQLVGTSKSTLPPLLNAIEAFTEINFPQMETDGDDVYGIKNVQDSYGLDRISWQGDPCVPIQFLWDGLNCDNSDNSTPPIITSLDLSNNNLTGEIPEFLADIKSLLVIDLSGNNITGSVPPSVLQKKGMKLNVDNNPHLLCTGGSCVNIGENKPKKNSIIVPVAASIAALAVLIGAFIMFLVLRKKKASKLEDGRSSQQAIMTKNRRFTYSEVMTMTNNFQRVLGKGGFGIVYHGVVNGTEQVAVKILSHSSSQGYKQFKAEVELLLRVHHKNLVGLVGYCDENDKLALIYEYMANGDLKEHMSEKSDVYSFGIVLLEIITNRHVIDQSREKAHIAEWVGLMLIKGDIISIMDPSLNGDYDSGSVWKAVELAMSCLNPSSTRRPTMTQVVIGLKECLASENSRGGASRDMDSKSSIEVSMTFDTDVNPTAR
ncbi:hypothetical protein Bca4012_098122 [Brassica carinata]